MYTEEIIDEKKNIKMNRIMKIVLTVACILGAGISFFRVLSENKNITEYPGVYINIEIDKDYAYNTVIFLPQEQKLWWLFPTTDYSRSAKNIVMYASFYPLRYVRDFYIRIPEYNASETINAIDNISIFIGNKLFYFSSQDIKRWEEERRDGYLFLKTPNMYYAQSRVLKNRINYYGDFDLALKGIFDFLFHPGRYALTYLFVFLLLYLYRKYLQLAWRALSNRPERMKNTACLIFLILIAFMMRINGYVRHSAWSDEIYSATIAGHPFKPLIQTFTDSGNPPFYFMLLRFWFTLFGWSEETGTMLSAILGTLAVPALYVFVKPVFGRKTAFLAAFFLSICSFAISYSHEMRAYILKIFLSPVIAFAFLRILDRISVRNLIIYVIFSAIIVNSHYYGILFVISNFIFYILYHRFSGSFKIKPFLRFLLANIFIVISFLPFFLYQVFVRDYYFDRTRTGDFLELTVVFIIITIFSFVALYFRQRIAQSNFFENKKQLTFCSYIAFMPCTIFVLAFIISFVKPMISFHYIMPVSLVFLLVAFSVFIYMCRHHPKLKYFCALFIWTFSSALSEAGYSFGSDSIHGDKTEAYKEAREYIALDSAAHSECRSAMLDNSPDIAVYYGYTNLPSYPPPPQVAASDFDVLYVLNDIYHIHEMEMYDELNMHNIDDYNLLKICVNNDTVVFKKYLH
jgi:hypothetical protein